MRRILVTGINGFVGSYFVEYLRRIEPDVEIVGVDIAAESRLSGVRYQSLNLLNQDAVRLLLQVSAPDWVVHLAAVSSVSKSWEQPVDSFLNNTNIFLNIVEAVRILGLKSRILSVGSSEEYGDSPAESMPLREDDVLNPCNPYAVARVSQEMLSRVYAESYGINIVMTRSFNHIGPGQSSAFVVSSFVRQIVCLADAGRDRDVVISTGNVDIVRDFLDVRDVVKAYHRILCDGKVGRVYNVCGGRGCKLSEIIDMISGNVGVRVKCRIDENRVRPADNLVVVGDNSRLCSEFGWKPEYTIEQTLLDMIAFWKENKESRPVESGNPLLGL